MITSIGSIPGAPTTSNTSATDIAQFGPLQDKIEGVLKRDIANFNADLNNVKGIIKHYKESTLETYKAKVHKLSDVKFSDIKEIKKLRENNASADVIAAAAAKAKANIEKLTPAVRIYHQKALAEEAQIKAAFDNIDSNFVTWVGGSKIADAEATFESWQESRKYLDDEARLLGVEDIPAPKW